MVYTFDKPGLPLVGMLTYSALVTLYTAYVELAGGLTGVLLWPTVVLHVILTVLLIRCQWHVLGLRTPQGLEKWIEAHERRQEQTGNPIQS